MVFRKPAITGKTSQAIALLHFYDKFYSKNFLDFPETFQNVWKFLGCLEILQAVQKLSSLCRNFPDCLKTSQTVRKLSKLSLVIFIHRHLSKLDFISCHPFFIHFHPPSSIFINFIYFYQFTYFYGHHGHHDHHV